MNKTRVVREKVMVSLTEGEVKETLSEKDTEKISEKKNEAKEDEEFIMVEAFSDDTDEEIITGKKRANKKRRQSSPPPKKQKLSIPPRRKLKSISDLKKPKPKPKVKNPKQNKPKNDNEKEQENEETAVKKKIDTDRLIETEKEDINNLTLKEIIHLCSKHTGPRNTKPPEPPPLSQLTIEEAPTFLFIFFFFCIFLNIFFWDKKASTIQKTKSVTRGREIGD